MLHVSIINLGNSRLGNSFFIVSMFWRWSNRKCPRLTLYSLRTDGDSF
jgi:hypothetical protein